MHGGEHGEEKMGRLKEVSSFWLIQEDQEKAQQNRAPPCLWLGGEICALLFIFCKINKGARVCEFSIVFFG